MWDEKDRASLQVGFWEHWALQCHNEANVGYSPKLEADKTCFADLRGDVTSLVAVADYGKSLVHVVAFEAEESFATVMQQALYNEP